MPAHREFAFFTGVNAVHGFVTRMVGFLMPVYLMSLGLTGVQIGIYYAMAAVSTLIFALPMGITSDRIPVRRIIAASFIIIAAGYIGFFYARTFAVFCIFGLLSSFGGRFHGIASNAMYFKIHRDAIRDAGSYNFVQLLAQGSGMIIGAAFISAVGYTALFGLNAVVFIVLAVLALLVLPRTETVSVSLAEYRDLVLSPAVIFVTVIFTLSSLHWGAEMTSYGLFLKTVLHLTPMQIGLYSGAGLVMVGIASYLGMLAYTRKLVKNMTTIMIIGFLMSGIFHILMCVPSLWLSFTFRMLHECGDGLISLSFLYGVAKLFRIERIGGISAFITLGMSAGSMASSILFGYLNDCFGPSIPLIVSGAVLIIIPLVLLEGRRRNIVQFG
ncbi:MAG: MFS transporter [Spirochaetes bacterium]|nr:MFS transporter [Spirochaetota bacterium]